MKPFALAKAIVLWALNKKGYTLAPAGLGYFDAVSAVKDAQAAGLSLCDYLETNNVGGVGKRRDVILGALQAYLPKHLNTVVEIGPGTGMFLEKIIEVCSPKMYIAYETSRGWTQYLSRRYSNSAEFKFENADGRTLRQTKSSSADAAFAHAVFVYLPIIVVVGYLEEMARVVKPGGLIVFDCFLADDFGIGTVNKWRQDPFHWEFPVVIGQQLISEWASASGLKELGRFCVDYHASFSTYFVFRKVRVND